MNPHQPEVLVKDVGVDAALYPGGDRPVLILRPAQSFESAVQAVRAVLPAMHPDAARRLVREHLPGLPTQETVDTPRPPLRVVRSHPVAVTVGLLAAAALLVGGFLLTAVAASGQGDDSGAAAPAVTFTGDLFDVWQKSGGGCVEAGRGRARCVDTDGYVLYAEAGTWPDGTVYVFSYGGERIVARAFPTGRDASRWAREDGTGDLFGYVRAVGSWVLAGTDPTRIDRYADLIARQAPPRVAEQGPPA